MRTIWIACGVTLIASVLIRSAGIALVAGLVAWLTVSWLTDRPAAGRRLKMFVPLVFAAMLVQVAWLRWVAIHEVIEWPIGGWPRSYVSQLSVKSGNYPELGTASPADIPPRLMKNLTEHIVGVTSLLTHQEYINPIWSSPLVIGPLFLIVVGLAVSMWPSGGRLPEWYFVAHEAVYLLWPWNLEMRFLLPIVPLAGLYAWRGGRNMFEWAAEHQARAAAYLFVLSLAAAGHAAASAWRLGSLQLAAAAVFWPLLGLAAVFWMDHGRFRAMVLRLSRPMVAVPAGRTSLSLLAIACGTLITAQIAIGVVRETRLGLDNLAFDVSTRPSYPDIEAARWLNENTTDTAVVMARHVDVVYHYAKRRVIWFPPISEPHTLMEGIHKYGVQFVVVSHREWSYWLPREEDCFAALVGAYPSAFRLVREAARFRIYAVQPEMNARE